MTTTRPYYVAGEWRTGDQTFDVKSPYDGSLVASVGVPTDDDVEHAVTAAVDVFEKSRYLTINQRAEALMHVSRRRAQGCDGSHGWKRALARIVERSHPDCRKPVRRSFRFNRDIGNSETRIAAAVCVPGVGRPCTGAC